MPTTRTSPGRPARRERGFTLVELLVVMALSAILLTLGASAVRHFWFVRALEGDADEVVTQLRRMQQRVVSESHPFVEGVRFRQDATNWALVRYDPDAGTCAESGTRRFHVGITPSAVDFADVPGLTDTCRGQISGAAADEFLFFYARGSATSGSITIYQPNLGRTKTVTVSGITGRVEKQ